MLIDDDFLEFVAHRSEINDEYGATQFLSALQHYVSVYGRSFIRTDLAQFKMTYNQNKAIDRMRTLKRLDRV